MRTTMNFTLPVELKRDFGNLAKKLGTTPSNLLNMLITQTVQMESVHLFVPKERRKEPEIEWIDIQEWNTENQRKIAQATKEADNIFANLEI